MDSSRAALETPPGRDIRYFLFAAGFVRSPVSVPAFGGRKLVPGAVTISSKIDGHPKADQRRGAHELRPFQSLIILVSNRHPRYISDTCMLITPEIHE
jgi:hypothetical protein